jgi:hypothetical protein
MGRANNRMNFHLNRAIGAVAMMLGLAATNVFGEPVPEEFDQGAVFTLIEENDLIVDTDRNYTQGLKMSFLHRDGWLPGWVAAVSDWLPTVGYEDRVAKFGYELGQSIFTPGDTHTRELLENDRPYAGWLHAGLILQRRGFTAGRFLTLESFQMDLGIIGPESLAEDAQNGVHKLRHFALARGWGNQLDTEPGLALKYQRSVSFPLISGGRVADVIPSAGMSLGNVETSFRAGAMLRVGTHLTRDFGPQTISSLITTDGGRSRSHPGMPVSLYAFAGVEGWMVPYSAFLDGNLFHDSHSVNREFWVAEGKAGVAVAFRFAEAGFCLVSRSREFQEQTKSHSYGSLFVKVKF